MEGRPGARVVLAEDDALLRAGLASLLEQAGFDIAGEAGDATELLEIAHRTRPDLAMIDIRMPPGFMTEGLEAARTLRSELPEVAILILSAYAVVEEATDVLEFGERTGYLLKDSVTDPAQLVDAIDRVVAGGAVVDPAIVRELFAAQVVGDPLHALSDREREVLALMAEGRSNGGIARRLWVTESTVEKHVQSILRKLQLPESGDDHRRILAVLTFLNAR